LTVYGDNNSSIPETTSIPNTTKELKQSELRQREQKIRKREDELKIRERIIEESQNERTWFKMSLAFSDTVGSMT
jgi:hypothetical protein